MFINRDRSNKKRKVTEDVATPVLRRSTRRRTETQDTPVRSIFPTPSSTNKKKGRDKDIRESKISSKDSVTQNPKSKLNSLIEPKPTLLTLPYLAVQTLLSHLDVTSLEQLSKTCSFFDQLINGKYLTSLCVPFDAHFLKEISTTNVVEKKPLLKLRCPKSEEPFKDVYDDVDVPSVKTQMMSRMSVHHVLVDITPNINTDYMIHLQLSFLNLEELREIDLIPETASATYPLVHRGHTNFDVAILKHLSMNSWLKNVTKFSIMIPMGDLYYHIESYFGPNTMPNLTELEVVVSSRGNLSKDSFINDYVARLEEMVMKVQVLVLKVNILLETKTFCKKIPKVFKNNTIEKLVITAPCTFNVNLVMENLKEVELNMTEPQEEGGDCCSFFRAKVDDRKSHRPGLCIVNIGSVFENSPKLEKFMNFDLTSIKKSDEEISFSKWIYRMKRMFFEDFTMQGGTMEFKEWGKLRWFSRRPAIPNLIGWSRTNSMYQNLL